MEHSKNPDSLARKPRAPHGSRNGPKAKPPAPPDNAANLPVFEPVPRKFRHDGWTPARQKAFIAKLAETGNVSRAARAVNMSPEGAYWLRRQKGADSFRRAWEAALDLGVQRLKDELYERALEGQLVPVFIGGKLKGLKRVKNDRLLMFALRMNAKDEYGRRLAATYFDPKAARLHGGSGVSDGGERARLSSSSEAIGQHIQAPAPLGEGVGGAALSSSSAAVGQQGLSSSSEAVGQQKTLPTRVTDTITGPAVSRARRDDRNAAIVADFTPVDLSLVEIEAMQAQLAEIAAQKRAEMDGPADQDPSLAFIENRDGAFKPVGPLEELMPLPDGESALEEWDAEEGHWLTLGDDAE